MPHERTAQCIAAMQGVMQAYLRMQWHRSAMRCGHEHFWRLCNLATNGKLRFPASLEQLSLHVMARVFKAIWAAAQQLAKA